MKKIFLLASITLMAGSAQAQMRGGSLNGGGSLSFSHAHNYDSGASVPPVNVSAKNPGEFVPSTFESFREAVIIGQAELDAKPLSVAEAARTLQAWKKSEMQKPGLIVEQDGNGKIVISGGKRQ